MEINNQALHEVVVFVSILVGTVVVAWFVSRFSKRLIRRSTTIMKNDPTNYLFLRHSITFLIYVIGISWAVYSLPDLRTIANSLLAGAGILAAAVGFASQQSLGNIISGIFIVIFRPFKVNDRLRLRRDLLGVVEDITLRHTVIRDFENRRILIPNSVISQEVIINSDFGDDKICKWLEFTLQHDSDIDLARAIMLEEALAHPLHIDNRSEEDIREGKHVINVRVLRIDEYGITMRAWIWTRNAADAFLMTCELLESIKKRFDQAGVRISALPKLMQRSSQ